MPELLTIIFDIVADAITDTLTLIPFLYITYLAMEALEHSAAGFSERVVVRAGKAGPVLGGLLGALPQCGFSAMAATLYSGRVVTMGTVIAVFLSTSDEMLPVFISEGAPLEQILAIVGTKVLIGMVAGLIIDAIFRLVTHGRRENLRISDLCEQDGCECEDSSAIPSGPVLKDAEDSAKRRIEHDARLAYEADGLKKGLDAANGFKKTLDAADGLEKGSDKFDGFKKHLKLGNALRPLHSRYKGEHGHERENGYGYGHARGREHGYGHGHARGCEHSHGHASIWKSAFIHTVQVTVFIFIISLFLDSIITFVGEDALAQFMNQNAFLSIFASGLVGLIPNCAASVAISDLYLQGALGAPAMMAGLLIAAGVGILVLFRANRPVKNTVLIVSVLYLMGVGAGLLMQVAGIAF